jgi:predicted amino acid dehydrogenase
MTATNAPVPVIYPHHLSQEPTVICDIATPGDVAPSVLTQRPNTVVLKGGIVSLPGEQNLIIPGMNQPPGHIYGCLAETILLGLDNASESPSVGLLTPDGIRKSVEMVKRHGFGFDPWSKAPTLGQSNMLHFDTNFKAA